MIDQALNNSCSMGEYALVVKKRQRLRIRRGKRERAGE